MKHCVKCRAVIATGLEVVYLRQLYHKNCVPGKEKPVREDIKLKLSKEQQDYLEVHFTHHPPTDDRIAQMHEAVREHCKGLAAVVTFLPNTRERSLALTKIEEAMMWANACIARNHEMILENLDAQEADQDEGT